MLNYYDGLVSSPFTRLGLFKIGGRSTAIKLASGGVWVLASTPLTDETKATIDRLGPVQFVVGPNSVHHLFLGKLVAAGRSIGLIYLTPEAEFHRAFPNARLLTVEEVVKKKKDENLNWHGCQCNAGFLEWVIDMDV
jgi:hypothetical protein